MSLNRSTNISAWWASHTSPMCECLCVEIRGQSGLRNWGLSIDLELTKLGLAGGSVSLRDLPVSTSEAQDQSVSPKAMTCVLTLAQCFTDEAVSLALVQGNFTLKLVE